MSLGASDTPKQRTRDGMRVLLASDGSSDSRRAIRWLRDLPLPAGTSVSVLTVATLTAPPRDSQTTSELRERVVTKAGQVGERASKMLRQRWPDVRTIVKLGDPRVEIVHVASEMRVDMLALGTQGLRHLKRHLVGSTSLAVVRYAPCAVAIVRGRPRKVGRILVATDGSTGSRAALRFLSTFELLRDAKVAVLHVLPTSAVPGLREAIASKDEQADADLRTRRTDADSMLAEGAAVLEEGRHPVERLLSEGDPAREIVKIARRRDVDLVVLGARGLRTIGRLLLGSVSETVLHHLDRPVVIIRE